jgi:Domain of unknown function (DUF4336)
MYGNNGNDNEQVAEVSRRQALEVGVAVAGVGGTIWGTREVAPTDYGLWGILPVGTYKTKPTIMETIVPNTIWTMDQKFGILNVQVPLRMTVIRLHNGGGLLLYNPIAATRECLDMIQQLEQDHGPVRHIVVGSVALEHKVYAGVMAQKLKDATVWLTPGQYSFPVNLPDSFLGFPTDRTKYVPTLASKAALGEATATAPAAAIAYPPDWPRDVEVATLGPIISRDGAFAETVVWHRPTQTLLVTDTCLQITDEVPLIYNRDPAPLLYHARDTITDVVVDTPETRQKGWRRVVLFGLYFMPSAIVIKDVNTALNERRPDINPDFAGIYPWDWVGDEAASWLGLTGTNNKPLVAPILQVLLLNRSPVEVLDFADRVAKWDVVRIIPAHLKNNLPLTAKDYRASFGFLEESGVPKGFPTPLRADLQTLLDAEKSLLASGAIVPSPPKPGGSVSRADIIAQTTYRCRKGVCAPKSEP